VRTSTEDEEDEEEVMWKVQETGSEESKEEREQVLDEKRGE
jgi:hypothetical protein